MPILTIEVTAYNCTKTAIDEFITANPKMQWDSEIFDNTLDEIVIYVELDEKYDINFPENGVLYNIIITDVDEE